MKQEMDSNAVIGDRLKAVRKHEQLSQSAFSASIGVAETAYGNWERGASRLSLDGAHAIRLKYGISLEFLYYGEFGTSLQDKAVALLINTLKAGSSKS
jgi:transcriptional regulator with XRE-family HTH domain